MFDDFPKEFWPALCYELWRYDPDHAVAVGYHWLNICEGFAWFAIAIYVVLRMIQYHESPKWEVAYAVFFVLFGISDLWESRVVPVWLIPIKGLILTGILTARHRLVKHHYQNAKF